MKVRRQLLINIDRRPLQRPLGQVREGARADRDLYSVGGERVCVAGAKGGGISNILSPLYHLSIKGYPMNVLAHSIIVLYIIE